MSAVEYIYRRVVKQAGRGVGVVLLSLEGDLIKCMVRLDFPTTNNEAEYKTLVVGLDLTKAARAARVVLYCNFQVVTNQVNGIISAKAK